MVTLVSDEQDDTKSKNSTSVDHHFSTEVSFEDSETESAPHDLPSHEPTTPSVATDDSYSIIVTPASDSGADSDPDWDNISPPLSVRQDPTPAQARGLIQTRNRTGSRRLIFGASLEVAARISGTPVSLLYNGSRVVIGAIPLLVEICGGFIKEHSSTPDLFTISGSPFVIAKLHALYSRAPRSSSVPAFRPPAPYEHAALLLQYLHSLPSPLLPRSAIPWGVLTTAERRLVLDPPSLDPHGRATAIGGGSKAPCPHPLAQHHMVRTCEHILACFYASFCRLPETNFALLFYMLDLLGPVFEGVAQGQDDGGEERAAKLGCVLASAVFHLDPGAVAGKKGEEVDRISAGVVRARHLGQVLRFLVGFRGWLYVAVLEDALAGM